MAYSFVVAVLARSTEASSCALPMAAVDQGREWTKMTGANPPSFHETNIVTEGRSRGRGRRERIWVHKGLTWRIFFSV